jgi:hypothetical protein
MTTPYDRGAARPRHPQYPQPPLPGQGWPPQPVQGQPEIGLRPPHARRKRRVFLWVFLAIQALFILWLVVGLATTHTGPTAAQVAQVCGNHGWFPLYKSHADCVTHYGGALQDAGNAGKAIGAGLVVLLWFVVDVILGVSYGVYKLATRSR